MVRSVFLCSLIALAASNFVLVSGNVCNAGPDGSCESADAPILTFTMPKKVVAELPKFANSEGKPREAVKDCIDRHAECIGFEKQGECSKNPGWMIINCPKSCDRHNNACALRDPALRCSREALGIKTEPAYMPGDMDAMFSSIPERYVLSSKDQSSCSHVGT